MRWLLSLAVIAFASSLHADEDTFAHRLGDVPVAVAAADFNRIIHQGTREEWDQLHAYGCEHHARYLAILRVVDELPWKDSEGNRIRSNDRIVQFNGSYIRFLTDMKSRDFRKYVDVVLRDSNRSNASWVQSLTAGNTIVPGPNGDDGRYGGHRRLAIAVLKKKFPGLPTSYDWRRWDQYNSDHQATVQQIKDYIDSRQRLDEEGEPREEPKSR